MEGLNLDEFMEDLQCSHSDSSSENEEQEISDAETSWKEEKEGAEEELRREYVHLLGGGRPLPRSQPLYIGQGLAGVDSPRACLRFGMGHLNQFLLYVM